MRLVVAALILCNVFFFLAASQPQPSSPSPPRNGLRPRGGGHRRGPHRGGHHRGRAQARYSHGPPQNSVATPIPNQNSNPNPTQETPPASQNQNQNQNQNYQNQNQNQNPSASSQKKGGVSVNTGQENSNPGKLFGWTPKNGTTDSNALTADEFLHAHNWVRSKYNLPPLTWDENLASFARGYLMKRYDDCLMIHSNHTYGENLFWGLNLHWTPSDAVYFWYTEKDRYDFNTLKCTPPPPPGPTTPPRTCGHFTQVVWRDSQRLGCALQHCNDRNDGMLIACEYDPPGNYEHENPLEQHN